jgi:hypothetical protein
MPDLWDTNPRNAFSTPDEQPDPPPSGHDDDHTEEVSSGTTAATSGHPPTSDRAGDRVGGHFALARWRAVRPRLAPPVPWDCPFPVGM